MKLFLLLGSPLLSLKFECFFSKEETRRTAAWHLRRVSFFTDSCGRLSLNTNANRNQSVYRKRRLSLPTGRGALGAPAKTNAFRKGNGRMLSSPTEDKDKPKRKREEQAPPLPRIEGNPKKIPKPVGRWLAAAEKTNDSRNQSVRRNQWNFLFLCVFRQVSVRFP